MADAPSKNQSSSQVGALLQIPPAPVISAVNRDGSSRTLLGIVICHADSLLMAPIALMVLAPHV